MKALVVYYSFSGNTKKVAESFAEVLRQKGQVELLRLKPEAETRNFFAQCREAIFRRRAKLSPQTSFDVGDYSLLCLGTPVWALAPAPAINSYLEKLSNAAGKRAVIFTTYGSGTGVKRCVQNIKKRLEDKGVSVIDSVNIQGMRAGKRDFVTGEINNALAQF